MKKEYKYLPPGHGLGVMVRGAAKELPAFTENEEPKHVNSVRSSGSRP